MHGGQTCFSILGTRPQPWDLPDLDDLEEDAAGGLGRLLVEARRQARQH